MRERKTKSIGPCRECGCSDTSNFYWSNKSLCKDCVRKTVTKYREENLEEVQAYDRNRSNLPHRIQARKEIAENWKKSPKLKKRRNELQKNWQEKNTIKRAAHIIVGNAIRDGKLIPQPCEICGKQKVDAHHDDYTKPLDVRWLCTKHHAEHHKNEREKIRNLNTGEK